MCCFDVCLVVFVGSPGGGTLVVVSRIVGANLLLDLWSQRFGNVLEVLVVRAAVLLHDGVLEADQIVDLGRLMFEGTEAVLLLLVADRALIVMVLQLAAVDGRRRRRRRRRRQRAVGDGAVVVDVGPGDGGSSGGSSNSTGRSVRAGRLCLCLGLYWGLVRCA